MQRCLDLAIKGQGQVAPNPMVGCVIVHNDQIIGKGYHREFGKAHAEVNAIQSVENPELLKQSVLYVNLEPCSHHGKTPPCADLIVEKKIPKVVIGSNDPNPKVAGGGIKKLRAAGVEVITGVLKNESDFLNRRFITFHTQHRPYIILKWAQSQDGFMAPDEPKQLWLTNNESRKLVHQWRSEEAAILVGRRTMEIDKPLLTVRLVEGKNPVRITLGREFILPFDKKVISAGSPLWIFNEKIESYGDNALQYLKLDFKKNVLPQLLDELYKREIQSIIVEGGPTTLQHFINADLWDEARVFTVPILLKSGKRAPVVAGNVIHEEIVQGDRLLVIRK